jgi:hypothetical protein
MLTGVAPFDWQSSAAWRKPVGDPHWSPTLAGRSGVPFAGAIEAVIAKGLARDPEQRQSSAGALVRELTTAVDQIPVIGAAEDLFGERGSKEITAKVPKLDLAEERFTEPDPDLAARMDSIPVALTGPFAVTESVAETVSAAAAAVERTSSPPRTSRPEHLAPPRDGKTQPLAALSSMPPATPPVLGPSREHSVVVPLEKRRAPVRADSGPALHAVKHTPPPAPAREPERRRGGAGWAIALIVIGALALGYLINRDWIDAAIAGGAREPGRSIAEAEDVLPSAAETTVSGDPRVSATDPDGRSIVAVGADGVEGLRPERDRSRRDRDRDRRQEEGTPVLVAVAPVAPAPETTPSPGEPVPTVPEPDAERAAALTREGTSALVRGLLPRAIELFRDATLAAPRHAAAWRGLGLANERLGRRPEAAYAYERYLRLAPGAHDAGEVSERLARLGGHAQR